MRKIRLPKRLLAAALTAALTLAPASAAFTDTAGHWAESAIAKWSEEYSIIQGYEDGTFRPDSSITRGAFAGILDRFMKFQAASAPGTFSDTAGTFWEEAILKLHASGVYLGNGGRALASDTITRQQAVTMVARAFGVTAEYIELPYGDADQIADYAQGPISEMTALGYITDSWDGRFRPAEPITRAELVNLLGNMIARLVQQPETVSADVEGTLMINAAEGAVLEGMTIYGDLILAPGVAGAVLLTDVTVLGSIRNFSAVEPTIVTTQPPQEPENPAAPEVPADLPWVAPYGYVSYDNYNVPMYDGMARSTLTPEQFMWDGDRVAYIGGEYGTRFGIDVSAYQNRATPGYAIDWDAVAGDGVEFAMVRIGLRGTSTGEMHEDAFYAQNIDGAMAAGIDTGVYFFSQAITVQEAIDEADFVIRLLENHDISGPVAYDWEMSDASYRVYGIEPALATACALAFCQRIEEAGYRPMVYVSKYVGYNKFNLPQLSQYPLWFPEYKTTESEKLFPAFYYEIDTWQYSSKASIDGIGGNVDVNLQFLR